MDIISQLITKYKIEKADEFSAEVKEYLDIKEALKSVVVLYKNKDVATTSDVAPKVVKSGLGKFASRAAKDFADENQILESSITGSGKNGTITKMDVTKAMGGKKVTVQSKLCNGVTTKNVPCTKGGQYEYGNVWYCNTHKEQGLKEYNSSKFMNAKPTIVDSDQESDDHEGDDHEGDDHKSDNRKSDDHKGDDHESDDHKGDDHESDDHKAKVEPPKQVDVPLRRKIVRKSN